MTRWLLAAALCLPSASAQEAAPAPYRLVVSYDRPGLLVPHWEITVPLRGMAQYTGKPEKGLDPGEVMFRLSDAGRAKLGTLMSRSKDLKPCETKSKGIANMGIKEVSYAPDGGPAVHCSYNYTDNKPLSDALDYIISIANTLQAGLELDRLHRYDRLGLDPVMSRLVDDAKEGKAAEIGAIKPSLTSLATDVAVLDRVRSRAQQLLDLSAQQDRRAP